MKNIQLKDIGFVSIHKNKRSVNMRATVRVDGTLRVTIPNYVTYKEAVTFLLGQKSKLLEMQNRQQEKSPGYEKYEIGKTYKTKFHSYYLEYHERNDFMLKTETEDKLKISVPHTTDVADEEIQFNLRQIIRDIYRYEAKTYIIPRTEMYARKFNLHYNRITIKNAKSRWGSCSSKKNLNFNLNLMRLPDELIDYVILHELAHLKHPNHSLDFWIFLGRMILAPKKLDKQLQNYSLPYFAT